MGQRIVWVSGEFFAELLRQGAEHHSRTIEGLPPDAVAVRCIPDAANQYGEAIYPFRFGIVFESQEWPALQEGETVPDFMPKFERILCQK